MPLCYVTGVQTFALPILCGVAPRAGAWIEIHGLKFSFLEFRVAPRAGAWIEMIPAMSPTLQRAVAPRAGAWIEIAKHRQACDYTPVAPRAGAWIEIYAYTPHSTVRLGRPPRGGVD